METQALSHTQTSVYRVETQAFSHTQTTLCSYHGYDCRNRGNPGVTQSQTTSITECGKSHLPHTTARCGISRLSGLRLKTFAQR